MQVPALVRALRVALRDPPDRDVERVDGIVVRAVLQGHGEVARFGAEVAIGYVVDGYFLVIARPSLGENDQVAEDAELLTIEGLSQDGKLHPIQEAFAEEGAAQCGYCTPGFIMRTYAFLQENPQPTEEDVKAALAGNICRCTGYVKPVAAVLKAAEMMRS